VTLSWTPGKYAQKHNIYFGTNFTDVNTASTTSKVLAKQNHDVNNYDPTPTGLLKLDQTYYWRIDEVNAPPSNYIQPGDTWSFTIETTGRRIERGDITVEAVGSAPGVQGDPNNTINESGLDKPGGLLHSTAEGTMWAGKGTPPAVFITYRFDKLYKLYQMWVWNSNSSL
jgi:hypothetical protein